MGSPFASSYLLHCGQRSLFGRMVSVVSNVLICKEAMFSKKTWELPLVYPLQKSADWETTPTGHFLL